MIRRIRLPFEVKRPILACGADLKGSFAFARGCEAVLSDGFGDLADLDNFARYEKGVKSLLKKLKAKPAIIACDLHPGYYSTRFAEHTAATYEVEPTRLQRVQHHEAHIAGAIVDNGINGKVIGIAFDGTGYGSDGNIWGGEFFIGGLKGFKRAAHFDYVPMPGAEKAILEPWRMAASYLYRTSLTSEVKKGSKRRIIEKMIENKINSPLTSSVGRLFDAVASLVTSRKTASFEAQLPIELEKLADRSCTDRYEFDIKTGNAGIVIDMSNVIRAVLRDLAKRVDKGIVSAKFHNAIAYVISEVSVKLRKTFKVNRVVLSGGVFQNSFLTSGAGQLLKDRGFDVYSPREVPVNDSGIPIGQIAIANARL